MNEQIIIALVVVIAIAAHIWIYKWVKFKIHEGAILKVLQEFSDGGNTGFCSTEEISSQADIKAERVSAVCNKSDGICNNPEQEESWATI